ncbi:MAG: RNB domain-containing ribonuclease [Proteobacteria bacterium]|nr:RNB domain-containing ribonuclease [Pseudomonadota bacterium]
MELVTIDGEDARDFDDAVWCRTQKRRLACHRRDRRRRALRAPRQPARRRSARARHVGALPNRVLPMLPEALSNGLCSLEPDEDRLCLCCELRVGEDGRLTRSRFFEGVMRSVARLTYRDVGEVLEKPAAKCAARRSTRARALAGVARRVQVVHSRAVRAWRARTRHPELKLKFDEQGKVGRWSNTRATTRTA